MQELADDQVWAELNKATDSLSYNKAIQKVLLFAKRQGFLITKDEWEKYICMVLRSLEGGYSDEIRMLSESHERHSDQLREWVHEVCDYEGNPTWTEEEDYVFRVQYVLEELERERMAPIPSNLRDCSKAQLVGRGWLPCKFGLFCKTGSIHTVLGWNQILTHRSQSRLDPEASPGIQVKCDQCGESFLVPEFSSEFAAAFAALVRSGAGQSQYPMEAPTTYTSGMLAATVLGP